MLKIVCYGFFNTETDYSQLRCVIASKGYLIIYTNEFLLKGYALKLRDAKSMKIDNLNKELVKFAF